MDSEAAPTSGRVGGCHSAKRGTSEISVPSVTSQGADFNVLHQSISVHRGVGSILHRAWSCGPKMKELKKVTLVTLRYL